MSRCAHARSSSGSSGASFAFELRWQQFGADGAYRQARDEAGVSFLVGVESEFILLSATRPEPLYVNYADWSCSAKTCTGSVETRVLEEIANCLINAGIELQMYHAEAAPGQVRLSMILF